MVMGATGMGEMADHQHSMAMPRNSIPMLGGQGPFGPIDMGGMFTIVKVRDEIDYERDPGWYTEGPRAWRVDAMSTTPAQKPAGHEGHGE
jgi:hypothetical protein